MEINPRLKVAIIIPTMNRPDFMIRLLEYYVKVKSPHAIYISDAGTVENSEKLKRSIDKLSKHIEINYYFQPEFTVPEAKLDLYKRVKEKYATCMGDDDYQIPDSLTKCAEFLEDNPDYSSAGGHAISFQPTGNGVYGPIGRLANYPRYEIESKTASQRLIELMTRYSPICFSVHRIEHLIECSAPNDIKDKTFSNEFVSHALSVTLGKAKILNCLSFARQFGNDKYIGPDTFDWLTSENWKPSYETFRKILSEKISIVDGISLDTANKNIKQAIFAYIVSVSPNEYKKIYSAKILNPKKSGLNQIKFHLGKNFPWLKTIYQKVSPTLPLYESVMQPNSIYYKDFQPVFESFTGRYR